MRSAGTPCSINTSTAFIADPPVAISVTISSGRNLQRQGLVNRYKAYQASDPKGEHIAARYLKEIWSRTILVELSLHPKVFNSNAFEWR